MKLTLTAGEMTGYYNELHESNAIFKAGGFFGPAAGAHGLRRRQPLPGRLCGQAG